jgi:hypothetical protein
LIGLRPSTGDVGASIFMSKQNCNNALTMCGEKNEWVGHKQFLKPLAPEFAAAASVKAVERILTKNTAYRDVIISWVPRDPAKDEAKWGPAIADHLSKLEIQSRLEGADAFVSIADMNPLQMEFDWKMSDRLDENIDRTIKRLLQVKTNKQLLPNLRKDARLSSKFIDMSPNNANGSAAAIEKEQAKELPATVEKDTKSARQIFAHSFRSCVYSMNFL